MRTCICIRKIIDHRNRALDAKQYSERNFDDIPVLVVKITKQRRCRSDSDPLFRVFVFNCNLLYLQKSKSIFKYPRNSKEFGFGI